MVTVTGWCTDGLGQTYIIIYTTHPHILIYTIHPHIHTPLRTLTVTGL